MSGEPAARRGRDRRGYRRRMRSAAALLLIAAPAALRAETVPFDLARWEIKAEESRVVDLDGRPSLVLKGGIAAVAGSRFTDGIIEFDLRMSGERGFMGAAWRIQDLESYEEFYLRPHQSGNPDANQYQPVFHGVAAWQLYHGERYGSPSSYRFDQWVHLKIVVAGTRAEVYIDDMTRPALRIDELKRGLAGGRVGLTAGNFAPATFSNFRYTPMPKPPVLQGGPRAPEVAPPGSILAWQVSRVFDGRTLDGKLALEGDPRQSWTRLAAEDRGLANLARVQGVKEHQDTVFARFDVRSDREQAKRLRFGFSDAVKVYLNGRLLYAGSDEYRSRDYRFLGSIGLYDEVVLPLAKGENQVWMAVSESFGGWGVMARFEDLDGIKIVDGS